MQALASDPGPTLQNLMCVRSNRSSPTSHASPTTQGILVPSCSSKMWSSRCLGRRCQSPASSMLKVLLYNGRTVWHTMEDIVRSLCLPLGMNLL